MPQKCLARGESLAFLTDIPYYQLVLERCH